jgi:hypothetical protein
MVVGIGPLLPVIGLMYIAKWIDERNGRSEACDDWP